MGDLKIYQAKINDLEKVLSLSSLLFKKNIVELRLEFENILKNSKYAVFLLELNNLCVGFAYVCVRNDYVEGTFSSPVGYLEGIYMQKNYRKKSYAKKLLAYCENWILNQGIDEIASDCELNNIQSFNFHLHCGFKEVSKIICFTKKL
ncbi:aminoglycoside 6'-N-acetyltransferase [Campylobacter aviculae]|uniref:GNAT family N-acetyltransferase n=1 Tax=Campylobacter aviculae TaxID=2510190 RepID=A0A4U7BVG0_9BACT|nr:aminoglycoside 6'-N-acetyltransferase [Campylobacter aviculae]TKX32467.1 GNAT family N-acetyltransferase [Campylobacter aviculae]